MGGGFQDTFNAIGDWKAAEDREEFAKEEAKKADRDYWSRLEAMSLDPAKPSETAPQFKATKSPIARAYLESFLTGSNADAVQGTRAGSSGMFGGKAMASANFNRAYGGWDKLREQGAEELSAPDRFRVAPITKTIRNEDAESSLRNKNAAPIEAKLGRPLTAEENDYLNQVWKVDKGTNGKNINAMMLLEQSKETLERVLKERPPTNDVDTLGEYGGW